MQKHIYPAVFHTSDEGGYWISFPDFENILTQGESMEEACDMARDALGLELSEMEENNLAFPAPSDIGRLNKKIKKNETVILIEFDYSEYKRKNNSRAVKKTLSIPSWLNEAAIAKGINFSAVLQKALQAELDKI